MVKWAPAFGGDRAVRTYLGKTVLYRLIKLVGQAGRTTIKEAKMIDRIIGVFKLDADTFEQIEHDQSATTQAAMVVLAVALLSAIGGLIGSVINDGNLFMSFISPIISTFVGWLIWSGVIYFVGTSFFGGTADIGEMLRVVGFAYAPMVLGLIPCVGWIIGLLWTLAALVVATRQGLDVDTGKAVIVGVIGFVLVLILNLIVGSVLGVSLF
jgi:hypothetical protein